MSEFAREHNLRARAKIIESARQYLEPGEQARFAFYGRSGSLGLTPRIVVGTDRNLYVMAGSRWSTRKRTGVKDKYPMEHARVIYEREADALAVGSERIRVSGITEDADPSEALDVRARSDD